MHTFTVCQQMCVLAMNTKMIFWFYYFKFLHIKMMGMVLNLFPILYFSQQSRDEPKHGPMLASLMACTSITSQFKHERVTVSTILGFLPC